MAPKRHLLHYIRYTHLYLGVFIAPALLFFAFTGALQTFSFHETTKGSSYKPPAWIATLAQIHKKQTTTIPVKKLPPPNAADPNYPATRHTPSRPSSTSPSAIESSAQSASSTNPSPVPSFTSSSNPSPATSPTTPSKPHNPLPLKFFFLLVSLGLFTSTLSGLYMSYRYSRNRKLLTALLITGIILPIALTLL